MYSYKVAYTFLTEIGNQRSKEKNDIYFAMNCQEAADLCRNEYKYLHGFRIERIWIDIQNRWCIVDNWE